MTEDKLMAAAGVALFGERYKQDLANALGVSRDTVDDWTRVPPGQKEPRMKPKPGVWVDLAKLIGERRSLLEKVDGLVAKMAKAAAT